MEPAASPAPADQEGFADCIEGGNLDAAQQTADTAQQTADIAVQTRAAVTTAARWLRLYRRLQRLRRLQRYFGHIGQTLQQYPSTLRSSLQAHFPKV